MSLDTHTVDIIDGSNFLDSDRVLLAMKRDVVTPAGGGLVASVAVATPGSGYTAVPTVAFSATTGSAATAVAKMKVVAAAFAAAGSGYAADDTITVTGGTSTTAAIINVVSVDGSGHITAISINTAGVYSVMPSNPVAQGSTSGIGTGATFTLTWGVASITVSGGGTLYPQGSTASLSGGTPTLAATLGAVVVTTVAGVGSSVAVTGLTLPSIYAVKVTPNADVVCFVTAKAATGFTLNVKPRLAASSLSAGTADIVVMG